MGQLIDLTGMTIGKWHVIKRVDNFPTGDTGWLCKCSCEKRTVRIVRGTSLRKKDLSNGSFSCGCTRKKYNQYNLLGEYGIGYTKKGEEFYFDLEDYNKIKSYSWHITTSKKENRAGYLIGLDVQKINLFSFIT